MTMFSIKPDAVRASVLDFEQYSKDLGLIQNDVIWARRWLQGQSAYSYEADRRMSEVIDMMSRQAGWLCSLKNSMDQIIDGHAGYYTTEQEIMGHRDGVLPVVGKQINDVIIKNFGPIGSAFGVAIDTVSAVVNHDGFAFGKDVVDGVQTTLDGIEACVEHKAEASWKDDLLGLGDPDFIQDLRKLDLKKMSHLGVALTGAAASIEDSIKDLTTGWGIAGVGLDLASSGIDNYQEYQSGNISGTRAVAETVTETSVGIGKEILITAAVTGGLLALSVACPALAPFVTNSFVIGACTTAVSSGVDWISKQVTGGKDFNEAVSDWAIDNVENNIDEDVEWANDFKNGFENFVNSTGGGDTWTNSVFA